MHYLNISNIKEIVIRRKMYIVFLLFIFLVSLFQVNSATPTYNIKQVTLDQLEKAKESTYIIYFARNDCPECKKVDKYLKKNVLTLTQNVYRIETKTEPNKEKLAAILLQQHIEEVPTFLQKNEQIYKKVKVNTEQKDIVFQRLNEE